MSKVVSIHSARGVRGHASEPAREQELPRDEDLVQRALAGDRLAEDVLARRHVREVARVVARLLGSHQDVDDIVQDTFLDAFERLDRLRRPAVFRGWLLRIAIHKTRNAIRRQRLLRRLGLDRGASDATLEALADEQVSVELRVELAAVDEVLRRLPASQRVVWVLRHLEGHTLRDVSRLCGCSLATAKRWHVKAHDQVMQAVDREVLSRGG